MNTRIAAVTALAALAPAWFVSAAPSAPAFADVHDSKEAPAVVNPGAHSYDQVDKMTPSLRKEFPALGSTTDRLSPSELQRGGPSIVTDGEGSDQVDN